MEEETLYKIVDGKFVKVNIEEDLMESERESNDPTIPKYTQEEFEKIMEGVLNGYKRTQSQKLGII